MSLYDRIGTAYDKTRHADSFLVSRLIHHLNADSIHNFLDVACGSGNYTIALANSGIRMYGVDESSLMIETARSKSSRVVWSIGSAEALPYSEREFFGAICTLAVHHFKNLQLVFGEIYRVIDKGRFVLFTSTPEQMRGYWLNQYFPRAMEKSIVQMPNLSTMVENLRLAGFEIVNNEIYEIQNDLQDLFLYSGKERPCFYLDPEIRVGISTFASLADESEIDEGCLKLAYDIETGKIAQIISSYAHKNGDYIFLIAEK